MPLPQEPFDTQQQHDGGEIPRGVQQHGILLLVGSHRFDVVVGLDLLDDLLHLAAVEVLATAGLRDAAQQVVVGDEVGGLHEDLLHGEAAAFLVALGAELRLGGPGVGADGQFTHVQVVGVVLFGELRVVGGVAAAFDGELHVGGVEQFAALVQRNNPDNEYIVFAQI